MQAGSGRRERDADPGTSNDTWAVIRRSPGTGLSPALSNQANIRAVAGRSPPTSRLNGGASTPTANSGSGRPLDTATTRSLGPGQLQAGPPVRIHTDGLADEFSRRHHATALTTGAEVFFRRGMFAPGTLSGRQLIAHELAHVAQQRVSPHDAGGTSSPRDPAEHSARAFSRAPARNTVPTPVLRTDLAVAAGREQTPTTETDPPQIHRHASWEHVLMGDTPPSELGAATVTRSARSHVLAEEWARAMFFSGDATKDPRDRFPDVRWVRLRASALWVSYGELNALADYLPDAQAMDTLDQHTMIPILQAMRSGIRRQAGAHFGLHGTSMEGAAWDPLMMVDQAAGDVRAIDDATASLGTNRYTGLLARNACHFAPFSWQRFMLYHNEAREYAVRYHDAQTEVVAIDDVDTTADENLRQAILTNGYGDHFIQDSFAAGHLVNKTLVMQWFTEYINAMKWWERPLLAMPDNTVLANMTTAAQPDIAGRSLYGLDPTGKTSQGDRVFGGGVVDPQTAEERHRRADRLEGTGVRAARTHSQEQNYQTYLDFLNDAFLQLGASAVHNYFNERGLWVRNARGDQLRVGGDDTFLSESGELGASVAAEASQNSRQAIDDLLGRGETDITVEQILQLVPNQIVTNTASGAVATPLEQWQDDVLRALCFTIIFPELFELLSSGSVIRLVGPKLVEGGHSQDSGVAPVLQPDLPKGDFNVPSSATRYG